MEGGGFEVYAFCENNSISHIDFLGFCCAKAIAIQGDIDSTGREIVGNQSGHDVAVTHMAFWGDQSAPHEPIRKTGPFSDVGSYPGDKDLRSAGVALQFTSRVSGEGCTFSQGIYVHKRNVSGKRVPVHKDTGFYVNDFASHGHGGRVGVTKGNSVAKGVQNVRGGPSFIDLPNAPYYPGVKGLYETEIDQYFWTCIHSKNECGCEYQKCCVLWNWELQILGGKVLKNHVINLGKTCN